MNRETYINGIGEHLAHLEIVLNTFNTIGLTDINVHLETTFAGLLNRLYGWELQNVNQIHRRNPVVDLIDQKNKVCVQVTATRHKRKITETIDTFLHYKRYETYKQLVVLILGKKNKYGDFKVYNQFKLDIKDFSDLLTDITYQKDINKIKDIYEYLGKEANNFYNQPLFFDGEIEKIATLSECFIKERVLGYFDLDRKHISVHETLTDIVESFDKHKQSERWNIINSVFSFYTRCSYVNMYEKKTVRYKYEGLLLDSLCDRIIEYSKNDEIGPLNESKICMIIKGKYRIGKSGLMSLLYLNLLYSFKNGKYHKIPVYINLEMLSQDNLEGEFIEELEKISNLHIEIKRKVCLLLDGIPQFNYNDKKHNYLRSIYELLDGPKYKDIIDCRVECIDTNENLNYEHSAFYKNQDARNLIYLYPITTHSKTGKPTNGSVLGERCQNFVNAFCKLERKTGSFKQTVNNIIRLNFKNVDFNILTLLDRHSDVDKEFSLSDILERAINKKFAHTDATVDTAAKIAYMIYNESPECIDKICTQNIKTGIGIKTINDMIHLIICNEILAHYLLAVNYITAMKEDKLTKTNKNVLNQLYGDEISVLIAEYIRKNNLTVMVTEFNKRHFKDLDFSGQSMLIYVLGRVIRDDDSFKKQIQGRKELIDEKYKQLLKTPEGLSDRKLYEYHVAKRSLAISSIRNEKDNRYNDMYILLLLKDKFERKINREFYLEYYGDRLPKEFDLHHEVILKGCDFYNTFQILSSNLCHKIKNIEKYRLIKLELFTLCDLIQTRLDYRYITRTRETGELNIVTEKSSTNYSLFYNEYYNSDDNHTALYIIDFAISMISKYMDGKETLLDNDVFLQYLQYEVNIFIDVKDKLTNKKTNFDFACRDIFTQMVNLENVQRSGWHISTVQEKISKTKVDELLNNRPVVESVLQHTYEAYLLGLLYLPNKGDTKGYDKQKILNMILIHDLGEAIVNDYPSFVSEYSDIKDEEKKVCREYYFAGMHPKYATLIEYLTLWNLWVNKKDINAIIASDLDKLQLINKLFYLIERKEIAFDRERISDMVKSVTSNIKSAEVKKIYSIIIDNNTVIIQDIKDKYDYIIPTKI